MYTSSGSVPVISQRANLEEKQSNRETEGSGAPAGFEES
jgi:hypothetical protein